ncbi:MAG: VWA domain-containing protein [candidate division Zixibacteria bacterium]|nr:VWA domain-containing protein [candidate division Zixibacteria bacterium]
MNIRFESPYILLLLLLIPLYIYLRMYRSKESNPWMTYSNVGILAGIKPSLKSRLKILTPIMHILALALLVIAAARPQSGAISREINSEGIDIMLALDISSSMKAEDFKPHNRLHAAKQVIRDFVGGRTSDRIGLVVFSRQSFTQCPLTIDYDVLLNYLDEVEFGMIEDGTAIGLAIANCVNRLKESQAKSKVIILLTDGVNNAGEVEPLTAARAAEALNIKIYTIGAGKPGQARYPVDDPVFGRRYVMQENQIDEETLREVAAATGGKYFRAKNTEGLDQIYSEISEMEKTKVEVTEYTMYSELFRYFLLAGFMLLLLEILLSRTVFRRVP